MCAHVARTTAGHASCGSCEIDTMVVGSLWDYRYRGDYDMTETLTLQTILFKNDKEGHNYHDMQKILKMMGGSSVVRPL